MGITYSTRPTCSFWITMNFNRLFRILWQSCKLWLRMENHMSEVAHYYPMDVTRRTQITREQFEARQQAARKRWQATMTHADVPVIVVPWGSSSVAHGVVSTFEAIRVWVETNHVKAIVRRAGPM